MKGIISMDLAAKVFKCHKSDPMKLSKILRRLKKFVHWETSEGGQLVDIRDTLSGETIIAVFNMK
jgi:hypothetical protein